MRGHNPAMFMAQHGGVGPRTMGQAGGFGPQRPPNVQVGPEGMMGSQQEWRQLLIQQQQSMTFSNNSVGGGMRPMNQSGHQGNLL